MTDSPSIIRQEVQHSVTVTEGSQVATSKPSDPHSPQVRQNLVGEADRDNPQDTEASQVIPPPLTATVEAPAPVFERSMSTAESPALDVPSAAPAPVASDAPVFERSIQDSTAEAALPPALAPLSGDSESAVDRFLRERRLAESPDQQEAPGDPDGPVFERSVQDHRIALPDQTPEATPAVEAPVFERSMEDRLVPVPEQTPADAGPTDAPVFERSMQDRMVDLPETPPAFAAAPAAVPALKQAPREGSSPAPAVPRKEPVLAAPEPVELAKAQQLIAETASEVQARVEETIGAADGQWAEMDFPARVVKLKIENDKVRAQLDELEDLADRHAR
jgi:hypothetical protein